MKGRKKRRGVPFRRGVALLLALGGLWMAALAIEPGGSGASPSLDRFLLGESALLSHWIAESGNTTPAPTQTAQKEETPPSEDAVEEQQQNLSAVTPDNIQERTITGSALFNRTSKTVDLDAVAAGGSSLRLLPADKGPQILIMHTHGTESFARDGTEPYTETGTAHTTDAAYSILAVGDEITRIFEEMGFSVLHDKTLYDYPDYNGSYERSRAGAEAILQENPTIGVVLDIHRDALTGEDGTVYKPVVTVDGEKIAQVMLLVGSDDAGAYFPEWTEHLALALQIRTEMNALWPCLARPVTLRTARFNQRLTKGSLLVEVGSHGNTLEEAKAGGRLFARAAGQVLRNYIYPS